MKKNKYILLSILSLFVSSCDDVSSNSDSFLSSDSSNNNIEENSSSTLEDLYYVNLDEYKAYINIDLEDYIRSMNFDSLDEITLSKINSHISSCKNDISLATDHLQVKQSIENLKDKIANEIPLANGMFSFDDSIEIMGALEAYGERNSLTGITLYENGSYEIYSDRITLGSNRYIPNYGFGLLQEGRIESELKYQPNSAWKKYLHLSEAVENIGISDSISNGEGSKYFNFITSSYYTEFLNENKDGTTQYNLLANSKPILVNPNDNNEATVFKIEVKTGKDGLKYTTNSTLDSRMKFNNRPVKLEDYLTMYKLYFTQSNNIGPIYKYKNLFVGVKNYYDSSSSGPVDFSKVGVKVLNENNKEFIQFETIKPISVDRLLDYININVFQPIPQEFIDLVGVNNYFKKNDINNEKLMDNTLSLGAYSIEQCCDDTKIVFKKNPNYVYANDKYQIEGIYVDYSKYTSSILERFDSQYIDYAPLNFDVIEKYENYKNFVIVGGNSTFSLNVNSTDQETWNNLFNKNENEDGYWQVEPALSNEHFLKALSLSINRKEFSKIFNAVPSCSYLATDTFFTPFKNTSYNYSKEHENAIYSKISNTDGYGYNLQLARQYFKIALDELETENKYIRGTKENPTNIELEIRWTRQTDEQYHQYIKEYFETAFNDESVSNGVYKLNIKFYVPENWSDVYVDTREGLYDLSFGKISGSSYDPYHYLNIMSSDGNISKGFNLNWNLNTNDISKDYIIYDGKRWTYDALLTSLVKVGFVEKGIKVNPITSKLVSQTKNNNGSYTSTIIVDFIDGYEFQIDDVIMCTYEGDYMETSVFLKADISYDNEKNSYTLVINTSQYMANKYQGNMGFDIYYSINCNNTNYKYFDSVLGHF